MHEHMPREKDPKTPTEIAGQGNYTAIVEELVSSRLLEVEIETCQAQYKERIPEPWLNEKDWEMLTVLGLYDPITLEHCVHTYEIAKKKIGSKNLVGPDGQPISLLKEIEGEGVSIEQFLRACLLHDIGKVEVPQYLIQNNLRKEQWEALLLETIDSGRGNSILKRINLDPNLSHSPQEILDAMSAENMRPIHLVPARVALSDAEVNDLERRKISADQSVMDIINAHEQSSFHILSSCGCSIEAEIAGHHHNYANEPLKFPDSTEILRESRIGAVGSIVDYLHLMDVQEALTSKDRPYRGPASLIETLAALIAEHKKGAISVEHTYAWVLDEFEQLDITNIEERDKIYLAMVQTFLEENHRPLAMAA